MAGWIRLYRKFWDNPISYNPDIAILFLFLASQVNHSDNKFMLGTQMIEVKRGTHITSIRKLANRWGWSTSKVNNILKILKNENMITCISDRKKTVITLVNYDFYQGAEQEEDTQKIQKKNIKKTQKNTNKNEKNDKNEKKYIVIPDVDYVKLTKKEYDRLIKDYGKGIVDSKILDMDNYVTQKNKPYTDYNKALRGWLRKDATDTEKGGEDERERLYVF